MPVLHFIMNKGKRKKNKEQIIQKVVVQIILVFDTWKNKTFNGYNYHTENSLPVPTKCPDPPKLEHGKYQLGVPSTFYAYGKFNDTVGIINPTGGITILNLQDSKCNSRNKCDLQLQERRLHSDVQRGWGWQWGSLEKVSWEHVNLHFLHPPLHPHCHCHHDHLDCHDNCSCCVSPWICNWISE